MTDTPRQRVAALVSDVSELLDQGYAPLEVIDQLVDAIDAMLSEDEPTETLPWAIYSPSERAWWNNDDGWGSFNTATRFTYVESESLNLPDNQDCLWVWVG